jgi:hypothetical protein
MAYVREWGGKFVVPIPKISILQLFAVHILVGVYIVLHLYQPEILFIT